MENRARPILTYFVLLAVGLFFFFYGLVKAKSFLAPLAVAALLTMVVVPVARWFESKGLSRAWAALSSDLLILLFFVVLAGVVSYQVNNFSQDWPEIKERVEPKINDLQEVIADKTGISIQQQNQNLPILGGAAEANGQTEETGAKQQEQGEGQDQEASGSEFQQPNGSIMSSAGSYMMRLIGFLGTFLLTFVYIFFFLLYRSKFRKSFIKMAPEGRKEDTKKIISGSVQVAHGYLFGRLVLIVILAVIYSIGLSFSGVRQAVFISILAAVLTLIPYIGNIIGYTLALAMAFISGSGLTGALGVTATFALTQFVESYILEPYIVGDKVNLDPTFTIVVVVLGGSMWGVIGMLIAIPALGIAKVVFDNIPALNPLGYLFGTEGTGDDDDDNIFDKTKRWALNKFKK
ncbi:AI-2E family transporter [Pontibacter diazotrophicus]|uniref:AI-2E family transporter n=1 Tax=Pontibacter diazotrophicus TaxID=1400979 RepID=A0A3D8LBY7_9BACT|nr:AI-2E family transporter [Pontibacter diazotrophicus]RDV14907.1 AI-2E family transporter [Pontibacter diazotrophicus]